MTLRVTARSAVIVQTLWVATFLFITVKAVVAPSRNTVYPGYAQSARDWVSAGPFTSMNSFQHLPYFSDLMAPFAALPDWLGGACWGVLGFTIYATGLRSFLTVHPPDDRPGGRGRQLALACGLLVGCGSIGNYQTNVFIVGCWLWAAVAVRGRRWWVAAVLFALPMFKGYTLAPGLVFAALYPRQLGGRFVLAVSALLALPYLFHPASAVAYRFETMAGYLLGGDHYRIFNYQTLYETWKLYIGPVRAGSLLPFQALAGLAVPAVLAALRRGGAPDADVELHGLLLASLWCVSFGPSIEPQTYLLAAPALGWWLGRCASGPRPAPVAVAAVGLVVALAGSPLYSLGPAVRNPILQSKLPFLVVATFHLTLLLVLLGRARRARVLQRPDAGKTPQHHPDDLLRHRPAA